MLYKSIKYGLLAVAAVLAVACQPLERPFQPTEKATFRAAPGPRASLYIAPVEFGTEELREGIANKLQDLGIPAFTGDPIENRYSVHSQITVEDNTSFITLKIFDPFGRDTGLETIQKIGEIAEGPAIFEVSIDPVILKSASEIDILLGGSGINFETLAKPAIFVPIVTGAPGDGSETLAAAMQEQIIKLGIDVLPEPWQANYLLKGSVSLTSPKRGSQVVTIIWELERQNGEYIGKVEQKNRIRAGTLNGPWGAVAKAAARGGARGIYKLLKQVEANYFRQKS